MFLDILGEPVRLLKGSGRSPVPNAYLAGGTAVALILGHGNQSILLVFSGNV